MRKLPPIYFSENADVFEYDGIKNPVWIVECYGGEYDTSWNKIKCVCKTKNGAIECVRKFIKEQEPLIPDSLYEEANLRFQSETYKLEEGKSDDEIDWDLINSMELNKATLFSNWFSNYSYVAWKHDISLREDVNPVTGFSIYNVEQINS